MSESANPEDRYVLAIDLGTSRLKVGLVSMSGTVAWATGTDVMTTLGEDGCAEQHPAGWWEQITEAAKAAIGSGTAHPDQIAAVAVTGIWGSTVPVSGEGAPVGPCVQGRHGGRRPDGPRPRVERARAGAFRYRRSAAGHQLLPAGRALGAPVEDADGPQVPGRHPCRLRRRPDGSWRPAGRSRVLAAGAADSR
jgi:sugar (pentulose or hexulose) kinase